MFFFDTYAILATIDGDPAYKKYEEEKMFTSKLNVGELYHVLLKRYNKATAEYWIKKLDFELIDFSTEEVIAAMLFKHAHSRRNFSVFDVVGYTIAKDRGIRFLTGDRQFEDLENVEFAKANMP